MSLASFLLKRLALILLVLVFVSMVIFGIVNVLPGDVAAAVLGSEATPQQLEVMRQKLGLYRPLHVRYLEWVGGLLRGDLGLSLRLDTPVAPLLWQRPKKSAGVGAV